MKKINYLILLLFIFLLSHAKASSVLASTFGYTATDATIAFQTAINSSNDTIIVDLQTSDWHINSSNFFSLQNKTIIFQSGVKLKAIAGAFNNTSACLFRMVLCTNVTFIGYQAEFIMNKAEYIALNNSEFRHCLSITDCKGIAVKGLTFRDSGGDGIYVSGEPTTQIPGYSENIFIEDVKCINNYRQGMSICSVQNMTVNNCLFTLTKGVLPEAGVDIEPYDTTQRIVNLNFNHCSFTNNAWAGISVALPYLDSLSIPVSIKFTDCYLKNNCQPGNSYAYCEIMIGDDYKKPVKGLVEFERVLIDSSKWTALYSRKTSKAFFVKFKDCVFSNVGRDTAQYNNPIFLEVPDYNNPSPYLGGYDFDHVLISYPTNLNFLRVYGASSLQGVKDIFGQFTIVSPTNTTPLYSSVPSLLNVNFTNTNQVTLPSTSLGITSTNNTAIECNATLANYKVSRTSSNISYPLPVIYSATGSAIFGDDTHLLTGGSIIPSDSFTNTNFINARQDNIVEPTEIVGISLKQNSLYTFGPNAFINFQLQDCITSYLESKDVSDEVVIFPNPNNGIFQVKLGQDLETGLVKIRNCFGKIVFESIVNGAIQRIDMSKFNAGVYYLSLEEKKDKVAHFKIIKN
jgi:Secretion system C-terminal sorting domain